LLEALLEALLWLVGQIVRAAAWFVTDLVIGFMGYATARALVPVLTFGTVRVEDDPFKVIGLWRRTARGVVLGSDFAVLVGILLWIMALMLIGTSVAP
jgi:hypothetical protein